MSYQPLFIIKIYSHFFKITNLTPRAKSVVIGFCHRVTQRSWVMGPKRKFVMAPVKVFAARTYNSSEFRLHINQLPEFLKYLTENYIQESLYRIENIGIHKPTKVNLPIKKEWLPRDYQQPIIDYLTDDNGIRSKMVGIQTGKGKLQPLDAWIKIPGGWSTMGDMKIGTIVTAKDGSSAKVTGVFPNGIQQVYKVTFADGRSTECGAEHLWRVYYINTTPHKRWRVVDTIEMLRLISMPNPRVYVDLIDPEDCKDINYDIDPYILGVYLGDGSSGSGSAIITKPDQFIEDEIQKYLPIELTTTRITQEDRCDRFAIVINKKITYKRNNSFITALKELNLKGKIHYQKFIPEKYFYGSIKQRLALVQGLLDTDGTVQIPGGTVSYSTSSLQLAQGMQYLIRSLGGIASIGIRNPTYTYQGEKKYGRQAFNVNIRYPHPSDLFRLPRKKDLTNDNNQYAESLKLRVLSVIPTRITETQCISIDHPDHLYVTDNFIVTHNTFCATSAISRIGYRTVILIKPTYMTKWYLDLINILDISKKDIISVQGTDQLKGLIDLAKNDNLDAKFIIISNRTYQNFIKAYELDPDGSEQDDYGCTPESFNETLGAGVLLIDEVHQEFFAYFKTMLYTNIPLVICLSATLINYDSFMESMYEIMLPKATRYAELEFDRYIKVYPVEYGFKEPDKVRTTEWGSTMYSHSAFEKSIMKRPALLQSYMGLINYVVELGFIKDYQAGDKLAIFASTIDMCTSMTNYFAQKYPHLDVRRYVENDPYENVIDATIRITTIGSAGTAVDIPGLVTTILTVNILSAQSNTQTFGRLRKIPNRDCKFYYLHCHQIDKHDEFHMKRRALLRDKVDLIKEIWYPPQV